MFRKHSSNNKDFRNLTRETLDILIIFILLRGYLTLESYPNTSNSPIISYCVQMTSATDNAFFFAFFHLDLAHFSEGHAYLAFSLIQKGLPSVQRVFRKRSLKNLTVGKYEKWCLLMESDVSH